MEPITETVQRATGLSRKIGRQLLTMGSNRLALLRVEMQEERLLLLRAVFLGFGAAAFALLAGGTFTAVIAVLFYDRYPVWVLTGLTIVHTTVAVLFVVRLRRLLAGWQNLPASFDQLRKDRACLENLFQ